MLLVTIHEARLHNRVDEGVGGGFLFPKLNQQPFDNGELVFPTTQRSGRIKGDSAVLLIRRIQPQDTQIRVVSAAEPVADDGWGDRRAAQGRPQPQRAECSEDRAVERCRRAVHEALPGRERSCGRCRVVHCHEILLAQRCLQWNREPLGERRIGRTHRHSAHEAEARPPG
jgi:hypothetical protein